MPDELTNAATPNVGSKAAQVLDDRNRPSDGTQSGSYMLISALSAVKIDACKGKTVCFGLFEHLNGC